MYQVINALREVVNIKHIRTYLIGRVFSHVGMVEYRMV